MKRSLTPAFARSFSFPLVADKNNDRRWPFKFALRAAIVFVCVAAFSGYPGIVGYAGAADFSYGSSARYPSFEDITSQRAITAIRFHIALWCELFDNIPAPSETA